MTDTLHLDLYKYPNPIVTLLYKEKAVGCSWGGTGKPTRHRVLRQAFSRNVSGELDTTNARESFH